MDAIEMPKRPWWRQKRWWAAGALSLVVAYPVSAGPAEYCAMRDWLPRPVYSTAYRPVLGWAGGRLALDPNLFGRYMTWWWRLAQRHEGVPD